MARAMWKGAISFGLVNIPVELQVAVRSHQHASFVFGRLHHLGIGRLNKDSHPVVLPVKLPLIGVDGHDHKVVLRLPERAADGGGDSDDLIFMSFRAEGLADRVNVGE